MDHPGLNSPAQLQSLIDQIPFAKELKLRIAKTGRGFASLNLFPQPQYLNHLGTYQAGVLFTLAEITGGVALSTFLDQSHVFIVAKRGTIDFAGNSGGRISSESSIEETTMAVVATTLASKRKLELPIAVSLRSENAQLLVTAQITYYIRVTLKSQKDRVTGVLF